MKRFEIVWKKTHRPAGGLFVGARFVYPVTVTEERQRWKLVGSKFDRLPSLYRVWHIDLGLLTHTLTTYFRKPKPVNTENQ